MADEGATIYYSSKQSFDFDKACAYLTKLSLSISHPDNQLITGMDSEGNEFTETKQEKVQKLISSKDDIGIYLWLDVTYRIFWSFVEQEDYFFHNFSFSSLEYDYIEEIISRFFIKFALQELVEANKEVLGFTLDQFGQTEHYNFEKIFESRYKVDLNHHYISDITFLPREMIKRVALDDESQIIRINQKFDCIAKNPELADYLKSLL